MTDVHFTLGRDLDADGVIAKNALGYVPVEVALDVAIEAHRRVPSATTLRIIMMAVVDEVADRQKQLEFLESLPNTTWDGFDPEPDRPRDEIREAILSTLRRNLAKRCRQSETGLP